VAAAGPSCIVAIAAAHAERTVFTRFIPAKTPGQGAGMWRHYYERWSDGVGSIGAVTKGAVSETTSE
jgi:hypothetical protein